ncbi:hypothetical protein AMJ71_07745 [candidate division TA06 bacterium SM1_40]|uniref:Uncharacterized protein n=2 Tax=Bacteria division TA06 TaxID=1156500 RepID=A0A0S8JHU3_UNCT6|nr:MAG: hypothetical protein AMJ82_11050 [candidate division TA06 bacterium SM23_40]KPL08946.1 MAG: hypothetical protein AMJ71_07745 [candidate division TA06 bacterium SM1_40]
MRSLNKASVWAMIATLIVLAFYAGCGRNDLPTSPSTPAAGTERNIIPAGEFLTDGPTARTSEDRTVVAESGNEWDRDGDNGSLNLIPIGELPRAGHGREGPEFPIFVEQMIHRNKGGEVDNGLMRVVIPPQALQHSMSISILRDPRYALADFGPDGTQFLNKVDLRFGVEHLDLGGLAPQDLNIYRWDEGNRTWRIVDSEFDVDNQEVVAQIEHFSRYALSD